MQYMIKTASLLFSKQGEKQTNIKNKVQIVYLTPQTAPRRSFRVAFLGSSTGKVCRHVMFLIS